MTDRYRAFQEPPPYDKVTTGCDPIGALEMSERLGVQDRTIHMIRRRGQLPTPDYEQVNGSRAWEWATILWWAGETDRLRSPDLVAQYRKMFRMEPPDHAAKTPPGVTQHVDTTPATPKVPTIPKTKARAKRKSA